MMNEQKININDYDHYIYIGSIDRNGYNLLCNAIQKNKKKDKVMLCISTYGGNPDAGFRIGRALQHYYNGDVTTYIIDICKSAGTLTVLASKEIIMADKGELGPLDTQLRNNDDIDKINSGLDIFKTLETLEKMAGQSFTRYLSQIKFNYGLGTLASSNIATKLVNSIIKPITKQIDPIKIGEHQRAIDIAMEYGQRLNETSGNLESNDALYKLIGGYPSHGFVIDRKEARSLFTNVYRDDESIAEYYSKIRIILDINPDIIFTQQYVEFFDNKEKNSHEDESTQPD